MSEQPQEFVGCLEKSPEVAMWLGVFIGEFAVVDMMLVKLMSVILDEDDDMKVSHAILAQISGFTDRANMVRKAAENSQIAPEKKRLVVGFVDDILEINSLRNKYVHGLYVTNVITGNVTLTPWATTSTRRKSKPIQVTIASISEDAILIRKLVTRIGSTLFPENLRRTHSLEH